MYPFYIFVFLCNFFCIFNLSAINRFPTISPNCSGMLQVDEIHQIYWEESGNPHGVPVIFLHGGPGVAAEANDRTFFDPNFYRIILFHQRGCGKSTPQRCLTHNTTWDLVEDINKLREHLSIDCTILFGGSWGSTLALTYAIKHPDKVLGLILRGIFLGTQEELDWFYKEGAPYLSPKAWNIFTDRVSKEKRGDLITAYHENLFSDSYWTSTTSAAAWVLWEFANLQHAPDMRLKALLNFKFLFYSFAVLYANQNKTQAQIENHYFYNKCFFETDNWIIENIHKIHNIPGVIIQGKCDQICPWHNAEELHFNWPASNLHLIPNAGHASSEPEILEALLQATEKFKKVLS